MLDAVFEAITKSLKKKQEVRLVGFGTFSTSKRKAGKGRNPRTGEEIKIPATHHRPLQGRQGPEGRRELIRPAGWCQRAGPQGRPFSFWVSQWPRRARSCSQLALWCACRARTGA